MKFRFLQGNFRCAADSKSKEQNIKCSICSALDEGSNVFSRKSSRRGDLKY